MATEESPEVTQEHADEIEKTVADVRARIEAASEAVRERIRTALINNFDPQAMASIDIAHRCIALTERVNSDQNTSILQVANMAMTKVVHAHEHTCRAIAELAANALVDLRKVKDSTSEIIEKITEELDE